MKFDINVKVIMNIIQQTLLFTVSIICVVLLITKISNEKRIASENVTIEKLEKRISTIEGLIMTQQMQVIEKSLPPPVSNQEQVFTVPEKDISITPHK
jgi:hypothetical protein